MVSLKNLAIDLDHLHDVLEAHPSVLPIHFYDNPDIHRGYTKGGLLVLEVTVRLLVPLVDDTEHVINIVYMLPKGLGNGFGRTSRVTE